MAWCASAARSFVGIAGCAVGLSVFGWLRYYWVQHEVAWRPEARFLQYLLPFAACLTALIWRRSGRAGPLLPSRTRPARLLWTVGVGGALLAIGQWKFAGQGPWLLYAWMGLAAWGGWRVAGRFRLAEPSPRGALLGVLAATATMIVLHVAMQLELWESLSFGYRDIGLFARALHHAAQGEGLWVDSLGRSILGEHAFFALWGLVPACLLGADPFHLLIVLSAVCLNGPALLVAWYVRRRLGSNAAALVAALAWLLLPAHGCLVLAQGYGFHPIYLAVAPLFAGLALGALGYWRVGAVCMLLCLTIREDLALTVAAWGVYAFFVPRRRALGAIVVAVALAYLIVAVTIIVPHYRGAPYPHVGFHFSGLLEHGSPLRAVLTNLSFLLTLMLPLAGLPLRSWRWACVALPSLAETTLTTNVELHNLCFHYYAPAMVVLFFASVEAWKTIAARECTDPSDLADSGPAQDPARTPGKTRLPLRGDLGAGWYLLCSALVGQVYLGVGPLSNNPVRPLSPPTLRAEIHNIRRLSALLPEDAGVTASYRIAAHFLDAARLWTVRNEELGDLVVVDHEDVWDASEPRSALIRAHRAGGYQPAFANYHLVVLTRQDEPTPLAAELLPQSIPEGVTPIRLELGKGIELVGMGLEAVSNAPGDAKVYRVTLIWTSRDRLDDDLRFGLTMGEGRPQWGPFYFARGAYPSSIWEPHRLYRDDVEIAVAPTDVADIMNIRPVLLR